ncbi:MAG: riboflavin synthase [Candidatus Velthaea sp.]
MFSGLIAHLARVERIEGDAQRGMRLIVRAAGAVAEGIVPKDSIAINGVCLTATEIVGETIAFDVVPETIVRAAFAGLRADDTLNLELSLRVGDRLGGHLVYGHVDANAEIVAKEREGQGHRLAIATPPSIAALIVEKGYITVDGVSLTVASVAAGRFTIALIPETSKRTTLGAKGPGALVNLEVDPVARYAQAAIAAYAPTGTSSDELAWAYEI